MKAGVHPWKGHIMTLPQREARLASARVSIGGRQLRRSDEHGERSSGGCAPSRRKFCYFDQPEMHFKHHWSWDTRSFIELSWYETRFYIKLWYVRHHLRLLNSKNDLETKDPGKDQTQGYFCMSQSKACRLASFLRADLPLVKTRFLVGMFHGIAPKSQQYSRSNELCLSVTKQLVNSICSPLRVSHVDSRNKHNTHGSLMWCKTLWK